MRYKEEIENYKESEKQAKNYEDLARRQFNSEAGPDNTQGSENDAPQMLDKYGKPMTKLDMIRALRDKLTETDKLIGKMETENSSDPTVEKYIEYLKARREMITQKLDELGQ